MTEPEPEAAPKPDPVEPTPVVPGVVHLVGAGPGDPGLITRRGLEVLAEAEVVVYDHLASPRLLDLAPASSLRIAAGKTIGHMTLTQPEINATLADHSRQGRRVVRLKGGDPFVFGRGGEEAEHLHALGLPFEVVPGVSSGLGATAYAGIPVTHRDASSAVAFVTGHDDPNNLGRLDWPALARFPGTLVVYMGVTRLARICRTLIEGGKPPETPAAMVEAGTLPRQKVVAGTLLDLPDRVARGGVGPPALLVVGDVVLRRTALAWFDRLPLIGRRILVTRPEVDIARSCRSLERLGAEVLSAPSVLIRSVEDFAPLDAAIARLPEFDWLVFTSSNGVRHFLDRLAATGRDLRALGGLKIAAIGPSTAETLADYHLRADLVPPEAHSEGLADALGPLVEGRKVLLARADRGRPTLVDRLAPIAEVEQVAAYRNLDADSIPAEVLDRVEAGTVDWITLTSPAITLRLAGLLSAEGRDRVGRSIRLASISPLTTDAARRAGWVVAAEAKSARWESLVDAIVEAEARVRGQGLAPSTPT